MKLADFASDSPTIQGSVLAEYQEPSPFEVGTCYFVRTVTNYIVGRLRAKVGTYLVFEDASWVADTGRFADAMKSAALNEIEPFVNPVFISNGAVVDATEWSHKLPTEQK